MNTSCSMDHESQVYMKRDIMCSKLHMQHCCTGMFTPQEYFSVRRTIQIILLYFIFYLFIFLFRFKHVSLAIFYILEHFKSQEKKLKNHALLFCSDCCKDSKTACVFVVARTVIDFYSFEINKKSLLKTETCQFSLKIRLK